MTARSRYNEGRAAAVCEVLYEKDDKIGRITLNRPEVMNAIDDGARMSCRLVRARRKFRAASTHSCVQVGHEIVDAESRMKRSRLPSEASDDSRAPRARVENIREFRAGLFEQRARCPSRLVTLSCPPLSSVQMDSRIIPRPSPRPIRHRAACVTPRDGRATAVTQNRGWFMAPNALPVPRTIAAVSTINSLVLMANSLEISPPEPCHPVSMGT